MVALSTSHIVYLAVSVCLLCLGIIMVCSVIPACLMQRKKLLKKKKKADLDPAALVESGARTLDDPTYDAWQKHDSGFWLPSHDISAGDSSQYESDVEDSVENYAVSAGWPTETTALRDGQGHSGRAHYRSTRDLERDSSADSTGSSDTGKDKPIRISALEAGIAWQADTGQLNVTLQRLVLRTFKHRKADLALRVFIHRVLTPPQSDESSNDELESNDVITPKEVTGEKEIYMIGVTGKKEQLFTETIQVDCSDGLKNTLLKFRVTDKRNAHAEDARLEGQIAVDGLNTDVDNFVCVIMRPRPPSPGIKGEVVMSLCYLPTAEKLSIAILECKDLKVKEADEKYTATYAKVALVHRGRALKKRKTKSKAISPNILFNETYTFDVPRKHVQSVSIVLSFKQLIYIPGRPRMIEKTCGKCVLGAASQTESAQLHWREMMMNARKPIIQWHALR